MYGFTPKTTTSAWDAAAATSPWTTFTRELWKPSFSSNARADFSILVQAMKEVIVGEGSSRSSSWWRAAMRSRRPSRTVLMSPCCLAPAAVSARTKMKASRSPVPLTAAHEGNRNHCWRFALRAPWPCPRSHRRQSQIPFSVLESPRRDFDNRFQWLNVTEDPENS